MEKFFIFLKLAIDKSSNETCPAPIFHQVLVFCQCLFINLTSQTGLVYTCSLQGNDSIEQTARFAQGCFSESMFDKGKVKVLTLVRKKNKETKVF